MTDQLDVEALVGLVERIPVIDREIDYKYFGDYEMSEGQRDAVDACQAALHALPALLAHIAGEDARVAAVVAARDAEWSGVASRLNKSVAGLESAIRETPSAE
jgi:hypothetical protein